MEFTHENDRIYKLADDGTMLAEVRFPTRNGRADIDSTYVSDALRGQGVAGKLMEAAVEQIRQAGMKITPTCSYARWWLEQNPDCADLL